MESKQPAFSTIVYGALFALVVGALWCSQLPRSLWLDELQTAWVVQGSLQEVISRAFYTQGFSPFYYVLLWSLPMQHSEVLLRLPSVILCLVSAGFIFKVARRFFCLDTAWAAVFIFACLDETIEMAITARPYALAQACALSSVYFFIRWVHDGVRWYAIPYAALLLGAMYGHFLFGGILLIHALYAVLYRHALKLPMRSVFTGYIYVPIGLVPLLPQIQSMLEKREYMAIAAMPHWYNLLFSTVPLLPLLVFSLAYFMASGIAGALKSRSPSTLSKDSCSQMDKRVPPFALAWMLLPPLVVVGSSWILGSSLNVPRYYAWAAPGIALTAACLVNGLSSPIGRRVVPAVMVLLTLSLELSKTRQIEDWRGATAAVRQLQQREGAPVLLYSGVVESAHSEWLVDPIKQGQFASPVLYYPVQDPWYLLPFSFEDPGSVEHWRDAVSAKLASTHSVVLLALDNLSWAGENGQRKHIVEELKSRIGQEGFLVTSESPYGRVWVLNFTRKATENLSVIGEKS